MPSTTDLEQFLITGLSLGGVYALSGVGMVVLYRATGVLYLAFGAVGAMGALISWQLSQQDGWNIWLSFVAAILFGGVITLVYGMIFGPALAGRDPLVKATATLGLLLILLGVMDLLWPSSGGASRALTIPTDNDTFQVGQISVTYTNVIAIERSRPTRVAASVEITRKVRLVESRATRSARSTPATPDSTPQPNQAAASTRRTGTPSAALISRSLAIARIAVPSLV